MRSSSILALVAFVASAVSAGTVCDGQVTLSHKFIGEEKNVKVEFATCPDAAKLAAHHPRSDLETRQTNVCATVCTGTAASRNCFVPSGGGPDPNECHVISDALLFDSQNVGAIFPIGTGTNNTVVLTYRSCTSFIVNQNATPISYCRTNWASHLDDLAFNCQSTQNAHGGNCVATDQTYFIQVQHS